MKTIYSQMNQEQEQLQGVYIQKQANQSGIKPCCRSQMVVVPIGSRFITHGGSAVNVFNDIRSLDSVDFIWKVLQENVEFNDF